MNIEKYIQRIQYEDGVNPSLEVLAALQSHHLLNVPFENLDIHYGIKISLDLDRVYHKIIERNRGGFCYELNGLFYELLKQLGFNVKMISARVYNDKKQVFGAEFDHLAIIAMIDEVEYLVDVGFGEFAFQPLEIVLGKVQEEERGRFVIENFDEEYLQVSKINGTEKKVEYIFQKTARLWEDFSAMCYYHQMSSESSFTQKRLITRPTENGRITLTNNTLKVVEKGEIIERAELNEEDYRQQLWTLFGLDERELNIDI
ncbi:MAG: arylamine N-acetyltransferase [Bacteroidota bacterium]